MIVIYKSKTGFTEKYAKLISTSLNCPLVNIKNIKSINLNDHDTVIFGTRVLAGLIDGIEKIRKLKIKNLILFVTGITPIEALKVIDDLWNNNLSDEELKTIPHFYFPGGLCYEKMGFLDKTMMKFVSKMVKKKKENNENIEEFPTSLEKSFDMSDDSYTISLLDYIKNSNINN